MAVKLRCIAHQKFSFPYLVDGFLIDNDSILVENSKLSGCQWHHVLNQSAQQSFGSSEAHGLRQHRLLLLHLIQCIHYKINVK